MRSLPFISSLIFAPLVCLADATISYETDFKPGAMVPAAAVEQMRNGPVKYPMTTTVQVKGDRYVSTFSNITSLGSLKSGDLTVIDPANSRFAVTTFDAWIAATTDQLREIPPEARDILAKMKFDTKTEATGQTRTIMGIDAEETLAVLTITLPAPESSQPGAPRQIEMRMSVWHAKAGEAERVPALKEVSGAMSRIMANFDPSKAMTGMFGAAGMGDSMKSFTGVFQREGRTLLGYSGGLRVPGFAEMARQAGQAPPPGVDLDGPMVEMSMSLKELNTNPISADAFVVPKGFKQVEAAEVVATMMGRATPKPQPAPAAVPPAEAKPASKAK